MRIGQRGAVAGLVAVERRGTVEVLRPAAPPSEHTDPSPFVLEVIEHLRVCQAGVMALIVPPCLFQPSAIDAAWPRPDDPGATHRGWLAENEREAQALREENACRRFVLEARRCESFILCALQGPIALPYLGMALACDYRLAADDTVFVNQCLERGMPPGAALPWMLCRFVGLGRATELLLDREQLGAHDAHALGLVNRVVPAGHLDRRTVAYAEWLASRPPAGLAVLKQSLGAAHGCFETSLEREEKAFLRCVYRSRPPE